MAELSSGQSVATSGRHWAIFGPTIFLSASLLFFVQPLFAKMVLPILGGAPAVWTTAMLFFQSALILGYGYAHLLSRHCNVAAQITIHAGLWIAACLSLPLAVNLGWQFDPEAPIAWQTLVVFAAGVGLPFVALSANAPLIQHWYARLDAPDSGNPYVLYGASNLGSLLSLLAFPLVAEPLLGAQAISSWWSIWFVLLGGALFLAAAAAAQRTGWRPRLIRVGAAKPSTISDRRQIGRWLFLAFLPSSLMLVVTTKIATDFGSVPLVWVVPLALYLATFVLVFTRKPMIGHASLRVLALAALAFLLVVFTRGFGPSLTLPVGAGMVAAFFVLTLYAHDCLYRARPDEANLTLFYLVMSLGGALGGFFNSILAPSFFDDLHEGPITLALFALILMKGSGPIRGAAYGVVGAAGFYLAAHWTGAAEVESTWVGLLMLALAGLLVLRLALQPHALVPFVALALVLSTVANTGDTLLKDRSFFGTHKVLEKNGIRHYANGTTLHGSQRVVDIGAARPAPLAYYHVMAPMGQIMASPRGQDAERIGVVGLGVGALACYAAQGQKWDFYEIDPKVHQIARHSGRFTFLETCTPQAPTHLGDARVVLQNQPEKIFDILVIDAYSSDAVPVHLTTVEAMELYLDRLKPDGLLVMHISNRYFSLAEPIAQIADQLGLEIRIQRYLGSGDPSEGDKASDVLVIARDLAALGTMATDPRWEMVDPGNFPLWTDDHANALAALKALRH